MIAHRVTGTVKNTSKELTLSFAFANDVDLVEPVALRPVELGGDAESVSRWRNIALDAADGSPALWHPLGAGKASFERLNFCEAVLGRFAATGEYAGEWRFTFEGNLPIPRSPALSQAGAVY